MWKEKGDVWHDNIYPSSERERERLKFQMEEHSGGDKAERLSSLQAWEHLNRMLFTLRSRASHPTISRPTYFASSHNKVFIKLLIRDVRAFSPQLFVQMQHPNLQLREVLKASHCVTTYCADNILCLMAKSPESRGDFPLHTFGRKVCTI